MGWWETVIDPVPGYLEALVDHVPPGCRAVLDVGCGSGALTRRLAAVSGEALGIDRAPHMIEAAQQQSAGTKNVTFRCDDFVETELPRDHFDFVVATASLHHMDLRAALAKMRDVTSPGGVVAVLGLARDRSVADFAMSAIGSLQVHTVAWPRRRKRRDPHGMPLRDPTMTYAQVRDHASDVLPGVRYRRLPAFRYSLVWHKPG